MERYRGESLQIDGVEYFILIRPRRTENNSEYYIAFLENEEDYLFFLYWLKENDLVPAHDNLEQASHLSMQHKTNISDAAVRYVKKNWSPLSEKAQ